MPRKAEVRHLADRNLWYFQVKGVRHPLLRGPDNKKTKAEAERLARRLQVELEDRPTVGRVRLLGDLCADFLDDMRDRAERGQVTIKRFKVVADHLKPFLRAYGDLGVTDLGPAELDAYLAGKSWSEHTRASFVRIVVAAYRWGKETRRIACDPPRPTQGARPRPPARRPEGAIPDPATARKIIAHCPPGLADLASFVLATGARPGEAARIEARHVRNGIVVLEAHKTAKKTGRPRKIALPDGGEATAIVDRLSALRPEGTLFRNANGTPWKAQAWGRVFARARKAAGVDPRITLYSFRHAYATHALKSGKDIETVAKLMGHSGSATTSRVYSDLDSDDEWLKRAAGG